jgi:hypothetical protein
MKKIPGEHTTARFQVLQMIQGRVHTISSPEGSNVVRAHSAAAIPRYMNTEKKKKRTTPSPSDSSCSSGLSEQAFTPVRISIHSSILNVSTKNSGSGAGKSCNSISADIVIWEKEKKKKRGTVVFIFSLC